MNTNDLIQLDQSIYRVLEVSDNLVLVFDCTRTALPIWITIDELNAGQAITETELYSKIGHKQRTELTQQDLQICNRKYTMIASTLAVIGDKQRRTKAISDAAKQYGVTTKCIKKLLCQYLTINDKSVFAPKEHQESGLTEYQRNIRWSLNKYYYTRHGKSLTETYTMLIAEKYTDSTGRVVSNHPTKAQFDYYFRKHCSKQTLYISRDGLKRYQMDKRPLLGQGIREFAPNIGIGLLDATICDIYLCDPSGQQTVGRPTLTACIDAYSGLCCGYALGFEGGVHSIRELLLNTLEDKVDFCQKYGISISKDVWPCNNLMATYVTDRGSEYTSTCMEQLSELGVTVVNLPPFRPELKGSVERFFSLVQDSYKHMLRGKGIIETDAQVRGARDYRRDACLTIDDFERIVIHCILHYNTHHIVSSFPYSKAMLDARIKPTPSSLWSYGIKQLGTNLLDISKELLIKTLLPRTKGKYSQRGLIVHKLRYRNDAYTEQYLSGGETIVAYNPDNVNTVYLVKDNYAEFSLIESQYADLSLAGAKEMQQRHRDLLHSFTDESLQAKVNLIKHIQTVSTQRKRNVDGVNTTYSQQTKANERYARHRNLLSEVTNEKH